MPFKVIVAMVCAATLMSCRPSGSAKLHAEPQADTAQTAPQGDVFMRRDGKLFGLPVIKDVYRPTAIDTIPFPFFDARLSAALREQYRLLDNPRLSRNHRIGGLTVNEKQLREVITRLLEWQYTYPDGIHNQLEAWQIRGEDKRGNVLFTGYFTPIVPVNDKPKTPFLHPIYDRPRNWEGPYPTRREIEAGKKLQGLGLELAYAKDKLDVYFMQIQGSGFIEYPNGRKKYLAYNGTNRHPFRGLEKLIAKNLPDEELAFSPQGMKRFFNNNPHLTDSILHLNPSYTFFTAADKRPEGAGGVPLSGAISIAVDPRYIPLGSCLLAAVPVYDPVSKTVRHQYRILVAQDTGGRIRGAGHIDYYTGIGAAAGKQAGQLRHYGRLWLLLPKNIVRPPFVN